MNQITTAIIPEASKNVQEQKGTDLKTMITTHDIGDENIMYEIPKDMIETEKPEFRTLPPILEKIVKDHIVIEPEPKKRAGRPKKEK